MKTTAALALLTVLLGCSAAPIPPPADGGPDAAGSFDAASGCSDSRASSLPGVSLSISGPCTFTLAQARAGIAVPYALTIAADVSGVVPLPQDAGGCGRPGPSGLILFENLDGGGQRYCLCDTGLCLPPSQTPVTLRAGTYAGSFRWDGVNWFGPSDTGNPKGAAFPAGAYQLRVSATGKVAGANFAVAATYPIRLVP